MKNKKTITFEILIPIILIFIILFGVLFLYLRTNKFINKNTHNYIENKETNAQKQGLNCDQIDNAKYDTNSKKYVVTMGSNSSSTAWSIQNNLDCSPIGGSGSIFETKCKELGKSVATISYGNEQSTCEFSTEP
ncbi:MAG: hypothetical protein ABH812_00815 [bacterium]